MEFRYHENWPTLSQLAKDLVNGQCCYPECRKEAIWTHHAVYSDRLGVIAGREVPGVHLFPLCSEHHSRGHIQGAHHPRNWWAGVEGEAKLDAQQKAHYYKQLMKGWNEKLAIAQAAKQVKIA